MYPAMMFGLNKGIILYFLHFILSRDVVWGQGCTPYPKSKLTPILTHLKNQMELWYVAY